ncbi:MAG: hypothetical protein ABDK94_01890 [Atribacterota bacterium]
MGIAINPCGRFEELQYLAAYVDYVLFMSVEPGFGGQEFEENVVDKINLARRKMTEWGYSIPMGVDGGINFENAALVTQAGVEIVVVGTALFSQHKFFDAVTRFKQLAVFP